MKPSFTSFGLLACGAMAAPFKHADSAILERAETSSFQGTQKRDPSISESAQANKEWLSPVVSLLADIISREPNQPHNHRSIQTDEEERLHRPRSVTRSHSAEIAKRENAQASEGHHKALEKKSDADDLAKAIAALENLLSFAPLLLIPPPRNIHGGATGGVGGAAGGPGFGTPPTDK